MLSFEKNPKNLQKPVKYTLSDGAVYVSYPLPSNMGQSDMYRYYGGGTNYVDSCFELCFFHE